MNNVIKLSDKDGYTRRGKKNELLWGENITNEAKGKSNDLCSDGVIHAYKTPLLAVFTDTIHANYLRHGGIAWIARGEIVADDGLKIGCKSLTTVRRLELPEVSVIQRIAFGILSVMEVCRDPEWRLWADNWLSGKDRSEAAAQAAAETAAAAADAAARAARAAARAARAAARAARAAKAEAAETAAAAADAAARVVWAVLDVARAAGPGRNIDFAEIAEKAMQYE